MTKPQLASIATRHRITTADAIAIQRQLTSRDLELLELLDTHQVFTSTQIARLLFASENVARKRLAKLTARGVVGRFRDCPGPGSLPWRYTLGPLGAMITAASHGHALPTASKTHEKMLRLSRSQRLDHLLGINEFFSLLNFDARTNDGCALLEWWNERETAEICASIVRPDGYGQWEETGKRIRFFLEYDNGTETIDVVAGKLARYQELAQAGMNLPVLFVFTGELRQNNFHRRLTVQSPLTSGLTVASTSMGDIDARSPAGPVWLPAGCQNRHRLISLTSPTALAA